MIRRKEYFPLLLTVLVAVGALVYTFAAGNEPLLGLDLQGGVSVVLQPTDSATTEELDQAIGIIRRRVDALGVAEPEVSRQGESVIVSLPGIEDPQRALDLIGKTAEMRFRPVIEEVTDGREVTPPEDDRPEDEVIVAELDADGNEIGRYLLGPMVIRGDALSTAVAQYDQFNIRWTILLTFNGGADGLDGFNSLAAFCFNRGPECPDGRMAVVVDGVAVSVAGFETAEFTDPDVVLSGAFDEQSAKDLALALRYGALPVQLEPQQTQTVTATLGSDTLEAGVAAGVVGLVLVALYMFVYYRLLGVVAIASLAVSFGLLWSIVSWLGESRGLALTIAGVTGLIVSIGVSVDSNIVYFENIKEDVRGGRRLRDAAQGSFRSAFSTIVKADVTTLIGAALLYILSIGPVRGFAFYLGLATLLDLIVSYTFMWHVVTALGRSRRLQSRPAWLGIPRSFAAAPAGGDR